MSIDTSKIEVGDWCEDCYGWFRVAEVHEKTVLPEDREPDGYVPKPYIAAHRPKSGPFKVGDIVQSDFASKCGGCLVIEVDDEYVRMKTHGGTHRDLKNHCTLHRPVEAIAHAKNCTLHRPVEAIEAERDGSVAISVLNEKEQAKVIENLLGGLSDLSLIKGYRIERIEKPVTLADLPQIGFVDDAGIEWQDIGSNDVWHGGFINYASMAPVEIAEYLTKMSRQLIAEGKLDDAVTERAEVIS